MDCRVRLWVDLCRVVKLWLSLDLLAELKSYSVSLVLDRDRKNAERGRQ